MNALGSSPYSSSYDVVIVGGAMIGSSVAWWLSNNAAFDGTVLVVERDPTYENSSTGRTNSCMRQQFSNPLNILISQFGAHFVENFRSFMGDHPDVPDVYANHYGYMYLAGDEAFAQTLRTNQATQEKHGAATRIMSPADIAAEYPFYKVDDIVCGSINLVGEGYFDSGTMFDWWRRQARDSGVEYLTGEVTDIVTASNRVTGVELAGGQIVSCGTLVNASGPRAAATAAMAGLVLPVEPRKRFTWMFSAQEPLEQDLPLTIDPTGVHVRTDGGNYMAGCSPAIDPAVAFDDFTMDTNMWEEKVWPALAHRIPAFERIKVTGQWAGHYAHNTLDHNVIVGPHDVVENFVFANGFSGHGLQQSPAIGRGVAEWITHGAFQSLDLTPLGYHRITSNEPFVETAII